MCSGVIYSKLQIYTHTQNCTENKYVHAQGFYVFLTNTDNISPNIYLLPFSSVVVTFCPTSGETSSSSSSSPVCSVTRWEAGLAGRREQASRDFSCSLAAFCLQRDRRRRKQQRLWWQRLRRRTWMRKRRRCGRRRRAAVRSQRRGGSRSAGRPSAGRGSDAATRHTAL